jgi:energy-coupling factor transporter ATP-binding protein EcfA2
MRLITFRVASFRNILDSTVIAVDDHVTCLVGKNESGKTALLQALHRVNPAQDAVFDLESHYPRWLLSRHRKRGVAQAATPITAVFELDAQDVALVEDALGAGVLASTRIAVTRGYDGAAALAVEVGPSADGDEADPGAAERLAADAAKLLWSRVPKFFYFSDYSLLEGRIDLRRLEQSRTAPGADSLQTARALLELAGADMGRVEQEEYELRKAELDAVSEDLSREVATYWKQNDQLEVVIDIDKETVPVPGLPRGHTAVARFLDIRVRDRRHGFTTNFGQRSSGFQWFFSFLAAFSEFEDADESIIVLLDEPALTLHARAQADFLRFIDERLGSAHQVLYTTHSPYLVAPGGLGRVRVVEDRGPKEGAVATADVLAASRDSAFPLQGALAYDLASNLFAGADNLLVPGTSDLIYLQVLSDFLRDQERGHLDARWRIAPVGGAQSIPTLIALLGQPRDVTILLGQDGPGMANLRLVTGGDRLAQERLVTVTEEGRADLEDLFDRGDYLRLYTAAFGRRVADARLPVGEPIVASLAALRGEAFDRQAPAVHLLRTRDAVCPTLSERTLAQFEHLFERLNATLAE